MINSARCPLCIDGIGHSMDEKHVAIVEELLEAIRWMAQTVHQGNHTNYPGTFRECPKSVCDAAKLAIAKAEGKS